MEGAPADLSRGELGDGLGALRDGMLGQLAREDQAHSGLDLTGGDGGLLGVTGKLSSMSLMRELRMLMALEETPVSGWTCFRTL